MIRGLFPHIFMPLLFTSKETMVSFKENKPEILYAYMSEAMERGVNGYPIFMTLYYLVLEEAAQLREYLAQLEEFRESGELIGCRGEIEMLTDLYVNIGVGSKVVVEEVDRAWYVTCPALGFFECQYPSYVEDKAVENFINSLQNRVRSFKGDGEALKNWLFSTRVPWNITNVLGQEVDMLRGIPDVRIFVSNYKLCQNITCGNPALTWSPFCGFDCGAVGVE